MSDYFRFLDLFCDPKNRKLEFAAYMVVNRIPKEFHRLRLATLLYTWRQQDNKGKWCPPAPDLSARFAPDAKTPWLLFLEQLEAALSHIRFFVIGNVPDGSVVAEEEATAVGSPKEQTQCL